MAAYDVIVKKVAPLQVAQVRAIVPDLEHIGPCWIARLTQLAHSSLSTERPPLNLLSLCTMSRTL